jgi:hypothetical protein
MRAVARRAKSGTVLAVSVQCMQAEQVSEAEQDTTPGAPSALDRFVSVYGRQRIPPKTAEDELYGWQFGALCRRILVQEIEGELAARNSSGTGHEIHFKPICEIEYKDGAKMTSVVGIFYSQEDTDKLTQCNFESLDFLPAGSGPIRIEVPKLTVREFKKLESQLPLDNVGSLDLGTIPEGEARKFAALYRYLPNFAVVEG